MTGGSRAGRPFRAGRAGTRPSSLSQAWRSKRHVARAAWRVSAAIALTAGVALVLLHVWVFWSQLNSGRLLESGVALRWAVAIGVLLGVNALRRRGVSLWWGRQAFSIWLLVALLHAWSASAVPATALPDPAQDAATFLLPVTAASLAGLAGLLLALKSRTFRSPLRLIRLVPRSRRSVLPAQWARGITIARGPPLLPA